MLASSLDHVGKKLSSYLFYLVISFHKKNLGFKSPIIIIVLNTCQVSILCLCDILKMCLNLQLHACKFNTAGISFFLMLSCGNG
jgi:hypothetical protein